MDYTVVVRRNINEVLAAAQARLARVTPTQAATRAREGWTIVDVRAADLRELHGYIPGAVHAPLNVLEWRVDPRGLFVEPRGAKAPRARLHEHY